MVGCAATAFEALSTHLAHATLSLQAEQAHAAAREQHVHHMVQLAAAWHVLQANLTAPL